jgi:uncharacterized protein YcbX
MATIKDLYFYPIKSFRGLRVNEMQLEKQGARYDREWMLVDEKGKFVTQRTMPILAKIGVRMDEAGIELSTQGLGSIDFGLEEHEGEVQVTVWKDTVPALEVSSEVSAWLSEFTAQKVKLVRFSPQAKRAVGVLPESEIRFADGCPLLVISLASLRDLEKRTGVTLSMSRFRPNLVVDDVPAYAEDLWSGFETSAIKFKALKPCSRCKITCTHPLTGEVGQEPLHTLSTYRREEKGVMFGFYYAHLNEGRVRVGETLKLV